MSRKRGAAIEKDAHQNIVGHCERCRKSISTLQPIYDASVIGVHFMVTGNYDSLDCMYSAFVDRLDGGTGSPLAILAQDRILQRYPNREALRYVDNRC